MICRHCSYVVTLLATLSLPAQELSFSKRTETAFVCDYLAPRSQFSFEGIAYLADAVLWSCGEGRQFGRLLFATEEADLEHLSVNVLARTGPAASLFEKDSIPEARGPAAQVLISGRQAVLFLWDGEKLKREALKGGQSAIEFHEDKFRCELVHIQLYNPPDGYKPHETATVFAQCSELPPEDVFRRLVLQIHKASGAQKTVVNAKSDPWFWHPGFPLMGNLIPGWLRPDSARAFRSRSLLCSMAASGKYSCAKE
jgi:hypothetical protein